MRYENRNDVICDVHVKPKSDSFSITPSPQYWCALSTACTLLFTFLYDAATIFSPISSLQTTATCIYQILIVAINT